MMTQYLPLDDPRDKGQRLYSSLLILGLDASALEHSLRTPVNQKMFVHMNKRLGEMLLHFLFMCIDREKAIKVFRDCWPLIDKKQESQFHKATFEWYKSLKQSYGQPVPAVVAKTFMAPGGPKFTSTLMTLTRIAIHSSLVKKAPGCILHFPTYSRNLDLNHETLLLLRASKYAHHRNFIMKQKIHHEVLTSCQDKAKDLCEMYRKLCSKNEKAFQEFQNTLDTYESLNQNQKDNFSQASLSLSQKEVLDDIVKMNSKTGCLWDRIAEFRQKEESSWKILSPLLDGTTSLSHLDGSMYSPQVPEMVYKAHANTMNKVGLHGLYHDDKLDLLSLIQYSNLALHCLLDNVRTIPLNTMPDSMEELNIQAGRVKSLNETLSKISIHLSTLLPSLMESVAAHRQRIAQALPFLKALDIEGKPHLCPPTPPLSLGNTPVGMKGGVKFVPLYLTPGVQCPKVGPLEDGFNITPNRVLSRAAKKLPKANVDFSPATQKDDSVQIVAGENTERLVTEAGLTMDMLTVDCHGRYLRRREQEKEPLQASCSPLPNNQGHKSIPKRLERHKKSFLKFTSPMAKAVDKKQEELEVIKSTRIDMNEERKYGINCNSKIVEEDLDNRLLDRLADIIANEDDSGAAELHAGCLWDEIRKSDSNIDSGCVDMNSDSDTLLEAIEKMNITPRCEQFTQNEDGRPLRITSGSAKKSGIFFHYGSTGLNSLSRETPERCKTQTHRPPAQFARLIDITPCGPLIFDCNTPDKLLNKDPFRLPVEKVDISCITKNGDKHTSLVSGNGGSFMKQREKGNDSSSDLLSRMSFLTQSPVRNNKTPLASKIRNKYDGLDFSVEAAGLLSDENTSEGCIVEELRHHSKAKLSMLIQQIKQQHSSNSDSDNMGTKSEARSKSNFISYVQNLKKTKEYTKTSTETDNKSVVDCSLLGKTVFSESNVDIKDIFPTNSEVNCLYRNEKDIQENEAFYNTYSLKDHILDKKTSSNDRDETFLDPKGDFSSSITRMQSLLGDMDDDTLTENIIDKNTEKIHETEENFFDAAEIEDILRSPGCRSTYLPESSLFDTLTDSILTGESDICILKNEAVKTEIRRESVSSCRQSLVSLGRMSVGSSKPLSEVFTAFENRLSTEFSGILDESDSCLLSTSVDEF
ncbi:uncharacterized protein [Panulirus ornatus]|uniref:uncharacterized protein n=1 Tax=Panulirus ornatus TaxID=150431 RepID=UPI003A89B1C4